MTNRECPTHLAARSCRSSLLSCGCIASVPTIRARPGRLAEAASCCDCGTRAPTCSLRVDKSVFYVLNGVHRLRRCTRGVWAMATCDKPKLATRTLSLSLRRCSLSVCPLSCIFCVIDSLRPFHACKKICYLTMNIEDQAHSPGAFINHELFGVVPLPGHQILRRASAVELD